MSITSTPTATAARPRIARARATESDTAKARNLSLQLKDGVLYVFGGDRAYGFPALGGIAALSAVTVADHDGIADLREDADDYGRPRQLTFVRLGDEVMIVPDYGLGVTINVTALGRALARTMGPSW